MLRIITDSTADLGAALASQRGIGVVPLAVNIGDQSFQDGVDLSPEHLFELVDEMGRLPKTAAPSLAQFLEAFRPEEEVIYIGLSSALSSTLQNATLAAAERQEVRVIDSLNLSTGIGLLALKAADLRDQGFSAAEIHQQIQASVPKVRTSFVIETLRYLHMGGRCSSLQSIIGGMLRLRPIIEVQPEGTLGVRAKVRGKRSKALDYMIDQFTAELSHVDLRRVAVTHAACPEDAQALAERVREIAQPQEVIITEAGSVISSHCGPQTIGLLYLLK